MIRKDRAIAAGIALVLVTVLFTVAVLNIFEVPIGNKVYISELEYEQIKDFEKDFGMLPSLKVFLEDNYYEPVNQEDLKIGVYKGLFEGTGDPYTRYMTKEEYDKLKSTTVGEFGGVGIVMTEGDDGYITVVSVRENSPAEKAGITQDDKIITIDGDDFRGLTIQDAAAVLKGESGTKVKVSVIRDGKVLDFSMKRANIEDTSAYGSVIEDNMGYIRILSFDLNTAEQFKKALSELEAAGVDGLVIDVRNNVGGVVEQSVEIADVLMDEGVVVYLEDGKGEKTYYRTIDGRTELNYVILVNGMTASASEVLSAGVQDNEEGTILGTQTYGKGIMQKTWSMKNGDGLEITFAQYFSPKGNVIHGVGITPDVLVEFKESDLDGKYVVNDRQLQEAVKILKGQKNKAK